MHSRTLLFLVSFVLLFATEALAQQNPPGPGGHGYFGFGTNWVDISTLNSQLADEGYPTFSQAMIALGGGGMGRASGNLLLGGEGYGLLSEDEAYQGRGVQLSGGYGFFRLGYVVYEQGGLSAYPVLGLGGGGMSLSIESQSVEDFDDVLDDPNRSATLSTGGLLLQAGASSHWLIGSSNDGHGGFLVGVELGYVVSVFDSPWSIDGHDLSGGPEEGLTGPYLRVRIGGGGRQE